MAQAGSETATTESEHRQADEEIPMTPWMMEADRQWTEDRPRFVRYLKRCGVYRECLRMAAERTRRMAEGLMSRGCDPITAYSNAKAEQLFLRDEESIPVLAADLAPLGQPAPRAGWRKQR